MTGTVVSVSDNQGRVVHSGAWIGAIPWIGPRLVRVRAFSAAGIDQRAVVVR